MKFVRESSTLVIAGSWNPAILKPTWVAQVAMNPPLADPFNVRVELAMFPSSGVQRFSFHGVSYSVSPQYLVFFLEDAAAWPATAPVARRILGTLQHTPITGLGFNFEYQVEALHPSFLERFPVVASLDELLGADDAVVSRTWGNKIQHGTALISFTCDLEGQVGKILINYHEPIAAADNAAAFLTEEVYAEVKTLADRLAQHLSEENLGE
ncbi:hypothetical protein [Lacisediminimonas sp.]|uniref:hypothetical protein n=1 Tax=Lacisediminimonas sp. TaxID=3060582 RepID=UPI002721B1DB|nr:hypothetical protein [Lacisediminimonas sp.]MDO8298090.1 hypothetical protein [Lacisediminimonas sp.]